jgi:hypothetical protein
MGRIPHQRVRSSSSCLANTYRSFFRLWLRPAEWDTPDLYQLVANGPQIDAAALGADHGKLARWIREMTEREGLTIQVDWVSEYRCVSIRNGIV